MTEVVPDVAFVSRPDLAELLVEANAIAEIFERLAGTTPCKLTEPLNESVARVAAQVYGGDDWLDAIDALVLARADDLLESFSRRGDR